MSNERPKLPAITGAKNKVSEKPPMYLLDSFALTELAMAMKAGAEKYARDDWRNGIYTTELTAKAMRHILAYNGGETIDLDSGRPHLALGMADLMMAVWMQQFRPDLDDRWAVTRVSKAGGDILRSLKTEGNSDDETA